VFHVPELAPVDAAPGAREFVSNFVVHSWEPTEVKTVGSGYTKLLILLEFMPISAFAKKARKRLKYGHVDRDASPVFFPPKSAKLKLGISSTGARLRGGLYWKGC
jgi:hypothetical protein